MSEVALQRLFSILSHGGCVTAIDGWVAQTPKPHPNEAEEKKEAQQLHLQRLPLFYQVLIFFCVCPALCDDDQRIISKSEISESKINESFFERHFLCRPTLS
jgi:hypothetical protein